MWFILNYRDITEENKAQTNEDKEPTPDVNMENTQENEVNTGEEVKVDENKDKQEEIQKQEEVQKQDESKNMEVDEEQKVEQDKSKETESKGKLFYNLIH